MAERIRREYALPLSVPDYVQLLSSREAVQARGDADGLGTRLIGHEVTGTAVRIVTETDIPLEWLPGALRSALTAAPVVQRTETWEAPARDGDDTHTPLVFSFSGLPVSGEGSARVSPDGAGSRWQAEITIRVDVPFIGGLVERAAAPQLAAALESEAEFYSTQSGPGTFAS